MSKKVVLKKYPREISGRVVKVNEQCTLPDGLALSLEAQGLCVIVTDGVRAPLTENDEHVERDTPDAKVAVKEAEAVAKKRAAAKKPAPKKKAAPKKRAPKKRAPKKKKGSS
jgi:hypothetical protein